MGVFKPRMREGDRMSYRTKYRLIQRFKGAFQFLMFVGHAMFIPFLLVGVLTGVLK